MMSTLITCRVVGFHSWSNAPSCFSYLKSHHRHEFVIFAESFVNHNDREIEINHQKEEVELYLTSKFGNPCQFGNMSCEDIAALLASRFGFSKCTVLEDGLCGAIFRRDE